MCGVIIKRFAGFILQGLTKVKEANKWCAVKGARVIESLCLPKITLFCLA